MPLIIGEAFQPEGLTAAPVRRAQEPVADFMGTRLARAPWPSPECAAEVAPVGGLGPK